MENKYKVSSVSIIFVQFDDHFEQKNIWINQSTFQFSFLTRYSELKNKYGCKYHEKAGLFLSARLNKNWIILALRNLTNESDTWRSQNGKYAKQSPINGTNRKVIFIQIFCAFLNFERICGLGVMSISILFISGI